MNTFTEFLVTEKTRRRRVKQEEEEGEITSKDLQRAAQGGGLPQDGGEAAARAIGRTLCCRLRRLRARVRDWTIYSNQMPLQFSNLYIFIFWIWTLDSNGLWAGLLGGLGGLCISTGQPISHSYVYRDSVLESLICSLT